MADSDPDPAPESDPNALTWHRLARRTTFKINLGWFLQRLTPLLVVAGLVAAALLLFLRGQALLESVTTERIHFVGSFFALASLPFLLTLALLLVFASLAAWLLARRNFVSREAGLVRLEQRLRLKNALTTAAAGIAPWPEPPTDLQRVDPGLDWRWPRVVAPFLVTVCLLAAAAFVPIAAIGTARALPPSQPLAWEQMDSWLETLEEQDLLDEQALEEVREKVEQLRSQPEHEWFSHASMEASDSLRQTLSQDIRQLAADLAAADRDLAALHKFSSQLSDGVKQQLLAEYDDALQGLQLGNLPLNSELLEALRSIDPSQLGNLDQLSAEQLQQLREALQQGAGACKNCSGLGNGAGLPALDTSEAELFEMLMGQGAGRGGITRGPGPAPISLADEETRLGTRNIESVQNPDLSRVAPGDVLATGTAEFDLDKSVRAPTGAGAVKSTGQGGEAVWRDSLLPAEKAALKRYFK